MKKGAPMRKEARISKAEKGFTLVELLVVIGIISFLIGILLPTFGVATAQSRALVCQDNLRQICIALLAYANDQNGQYPPNVSATTTGQFWYDPDRIGQYLSGVTVSASSGVTGGVLVCPEDEGGIRSYAMNIWASSAVNGTTEQASTNYAPIFKTGLRGTLWSQNVRNSSAMILVTETWSSKGSAAAGWYAPPTVGFAGLTPGERFGGEGGVPLFSAGPWGRVNCELAYLRHRFGPHAGSFTAPTGHVSIGYADGHVALRSNSDLVNGSSGLSTMDSWWSPLDPAINN
jgi:prepilin-type N-terminal cleavage/methylation domain-containing protein/prepilin-type processing-associated H-X9-DG protein